MSDPLVSIIIPCFNGEKYVSDAIESALAQTYKNIEVIVIDDGSTDASLKVIESYGDRIRFESGPNCGGCAARNRGIDLANGTIIQFLDADDLLTCDKLAAQVPLMLSNVTGVVYCDVIVRDVETKENLELYTPRNDQFFRRVVFDHIQTSAPIHFKKDLQVVGGFRNELPCCQEKDLHIRLACAGQTFTHQPGEYVIYRRRRESVSSSYLKVLLQYHSIVTSAIRVSDDFGTLTDDRRKVLAELLVWAGQQLWRMGTQEHAIENFRLASSLHRSRGLNACSASMRLLYRLLGPKNALTCRRLLRGYG